MTGTSRLTHALSPRNMGMRTMPKSEKYQRLAGELRALAEACQDPQERERLLSLAACFEACAVEESDARYRKLRAGKGLVA
jgi:hypothetical protein